MKTFLAVLLLSLAAFAQKDGYVFSNTGIGLTVFLGPGSNTITGSVVSYAGGTLTMTANATNSVYIDSGTGNPTVGTSGFPANSVPLFVATTDFAKVLTVVDKRVTYAGGGSGTSITLQTNGTNNGSQSKLNLAAGSNVTVTDGGTGTVTIASSAGGSVAGSDKDVQLNKSAAFGVDTGNFVFDYTNHRLGVATSGESPTFQYGFQNGNTASLAYIGAFGDAALWSDANSHHLWAEESQWNPTSNLAGMAAFDTATVIGGSIGASHYSSFQAGSICSVTGTASCGTLYGLVVQHTVNGSGTGTTNLTGVELQAASLAGGGTIGNNYSIHIAADTVGSSNWTIVADKTAHSYFAGCIAIAGVVDCGGNGSGLTVGSGPQFVVSSGGLVTKDNNQTTAGQGHGIILGATLEKAETGTADAAVVSVTPPAATGQYRINCNADVSSATSGVISFKVGYTDSNGTAQTLALPLIQLGTTALNTTFTTSSAGNYVCWETPISINAGAAAISIQWVGGGTTAAKVSGTIERMQ